MDPRIAQKFWTFVSSDANGAQECWPWLGTRQPKGYGTMHWTVKPNEYKMFAAHRLSYEIYYGPIPTGCHVLHHCDNPPCVNPSHLYAGTNSENMRDKAVRGRTRNQQSGQTHCKHGHPFTPENVYYRTGSRTRHCRQCGRDRNAKWRKKLNNEEAMQHAD